MGALMRIWQARYALALCCTTTADTAEQTVLAATMLCRDNPTCTFTGKDLPIDIVIENTGTQQIGYPEEYVRRRGPYVRLIDNATKRERPLRVGLANGELKRKFVPLGPGQTVTISTVIKQSTLLGIGADRVDLTAEITVPAEIQVDAHTVPVAVRATGTLRIVGAGADKP